jgi:hypothetical protein
MVIELPYDRLHDRSYVGEVTMLEKTTKKGPAIPQQVWVGLSAEQRAQAIRLMAQLAYNVIAAQSVAFSQERDHVTLKQPEDSSRPS